MIDPHKRAVARRELANGWPVDVAARESGLERATVQRIKEELDAEGRECAEQQAEEDARRPRPRMLW